MKNAFYWNVTACGLVRTDVSEKIRVALARADVSEELGSYKSHRA
jgi:hypothetical protein